VTNTAGGTYITDRKVTLYELTPTRPTIDGLSVSGSNVQARWDNAAANYQLLYTTNDNLADWQSVQVHGRTSAVVSLPAGATRAHFRLKTAY